jgi:hypothetical protein
MLKIVPSLLHCGLSYNKTLISYSIGKKVGQLKIDAAKPPVNEISKIVRSEKNSIRRRECD